MGATQTRPWDAVDHLRTEEDMIAYLDAVLAESDPQLMIAALHDIARAQGKAAVVSSSLWSSSHPWGLRPTTRGLKSGSHLTAIALTSQSAGKAEQARDDNIKPVIPLRT